MLRVIVIWLVCVNLAACSAEHSDGSSSSTFDTPTKAPHLLLVEGAENPINVGRAAPRLSWRSAVKSQQAYEIQVASSAKLLQNSKPNLWSSGRVIDGRSVSIAYAGKPLTSRQSVFWRVRIWEDGADNPVAWGTPATWRMGLLNQSDWSASWITSPIFPAASKTPGLDRWLEATAADPQFSDPEKVADTKNRLRDVRPATYFR